MSSITSSNPGARSGRRSLRLAAALTAAALLTTGAATAPAEAKPGVVRARVVPCGNPTVALDPINQAYLDRLAASPQLNTLSVAAARRALDAQQSGAVPMAPASITRRSIPGGPTGSVPVHIVRPAGTTGRLPAVVFLHGGGWIRGNFMTHQRLVRQLANDARAAVVFVDYSLSPEARYPIAIEQAYAVARWVARHGREIGVDGSRLAIAGDKSGGNLAAAVTIMAKQRGGPRFVQQVLFYPVTNADFGTASYLRFATNCGITRATMEWFWDAYAPNPAVRRQILASPLRASVGQLRGLPKALLITSSNVLRDEGMAYGAKLRAAGVPVTSVHYPKVTSDFVMLNPLRETAAAREATRLAGTTLRQALHG